MQRRLPVQLSLHCLDYRRGANGCPWRASRLSPRARQSRQKSRSDRLPPGRNLNRSQRVRPRSIRRHSASSRREQHFSKGKQSKPSSRSASPTTSSSEKRTGSPSTSCASLRPLRLHRRAVVPRTTTRTSNELRWVRGNKTRTTYSARVRTATKRNGT